MLLKKGPTGLIPIISFVNVTMDNQAVPAPGQ